MIKAAGNNSDQAEEDEQVSIFYGLVLFGVIIAFIAGIIFWLLTPSVPPRNVMPAMGVYEEFHTLVQDACKTFPQVFVGEAEC